MSKPIIIYFNTCQCHSSYYENCILYVNDGLKIKNNQLKWHSNGISMYRRSYGEMNWSQCNDGLNGVDCKSVRITTRFACICTSPEGKLTKMCNWRHEMPQRWMLTTATAAVAVATHCCGKWTYDIVNFAHNNLSVVHINGTSKDFIAVNGVVYKLCARHFRMRDDMSKPWVNTQK